MLEGEHFYEFILWVLNGFSNFFYVTKRLEKGMYYVDETEIDADN